MKTIFGCGLVVAAVLVSVTPVLADCVYGAQSKSSYTVLDNRTIMLTGGWGPDIVIRINTYVNINRFSNVTVLKDNFCSYESSVLYVDGNVVGAADVTAIR